VLDTAEGLVVDPSEIGREPLKSEPARILKWIDPRMQPMPDSVDNDRELERRVAHFLEAKHVPALRYLEVKARGGIVTLSGRVYTFYEKQLCNQCSRRVAGVRQLVNEVDVIGTMPGAAVVA
jgi:BON domain